MQGGEREGGEPFEFHLHILERYSPKNRGLLTMIDNLFDLFDTPPPDLFFRILHDIAGFLAFFYRGDRCEKQ